MFELKLLDATAIDCKVWAIVQTLKADVEILDNKFDETDEYHYYQNAQNLEKLIERLEQVTDDICSIVKQYRP